MRNRRVDFCQAPCSVGLFAASLPSAVLPWVPRWWPLQTDVKLISNVDLVLCALILLALVAVILLTLAFGFGLVRAIANSILSMAKATPR